PSRKDLLHEPPRRGGAVRSAAYAIGCLNARGPERRPARRRAAEMKMTPPKLVVTNRSYEELEGGQGREVFFRPHRYRAQDLAPLHARVSMRLAGSTFECPL